MRQYTFSYECSKCGKVKMTTGVKEDSNKIEFPAKCLNPKCNNTISYTGKKITGIHIENNKVINIEEINKEDL